MSDDAAFLFERNMIKALIRRGYKTKDIVNQINDLKQKNLFEINFATMKTIIELLDNSK